jgi:methyl-accepting chemotaxis protein
MANPRISKRERSRRLPLSARLSLLILFAAILPLVAVVGINDVFARATLEQQGRAALTTDAESKASLVELYLHERVLDGQALATLPTAPAFLLCAELPAMPAPEVAQLTPIISQLGCQPLETQLYGPSNCRGLKVGVKRDPEYSTWALYDAAGRALLSSNDDNETTCPARNIGTVPATVLQQIVPTTASWISPVYSDSARQNSYIDVYTSITLAPLTANKVQTVVGFLRATLNLKYIDNLVRGESGADGAGSYAFMTDASGIRIADSNQSDLFSTIMPLTAATQQQIASTQRFGSAPTVQQDYLPAVANALQSQASPDSFQSAATPGSGVLYQFVRVNINLTNPQTNAPIPIGWSYFVLSPISTVTAVANNQLETSLMIAGVIAILAVLLGLIIGRRVAKPVHAATAELEGAATALKLLASHQQSSAGEQQWVVDACKTGLESVRYLSDAMNQAAKRIVDAGNWFSDYWDRLNEDQARRTVQHLLDLARYIDEGARRQQASNDRLGKAITVTDQVSDQLVTGAAAATESAEQLEQVVSNLQRVVGGRRRLRTKQELQQLDYDVPAGALALPAPTPPGDPRMAPYSNRVDPSMAGMGGRAPRAPQAPWNANRPSQTFDGYDPYNSGHVGSGGPSNPPSGYALQPLQDSRVPTPGNAPPYRGDE